MVFIILSYIGTSLIIKYALNSDDERDEEDTGRESYNKPMFISYVSWSSFSLYFIKLTYQYVVQSKWNWKKIAEKEVRIVEIKTGAIWAPIYFCNIVFYYFSLSKTTYSSTMILNNISWVFVFIFGLIILRDRFSIIKLWSIIISVTGVCIIAFTDQRESSSSNHFLGDIFGVIGACSLALYSVLFTKLIPKSMEDRVSFVNILGIIGIVSLLLFWPFLIVFHFSGIENFQLPSMEVTGIMTVNVIFAYLLFDYWWGRAILLLGPLLVNTAVMLVVPLSLIVDFFLIGTELKWMHYLGTGILLVGFFCLTFKDYYSQRKKNLKEDSYYQECKS